MNNNDNLEKKEKKLKNCFFCFIFLCILQLFIIGISDFFNQMLLILFIFLTIYYKNNIFISQLTIFFILIQLIFDGFIFLLLIQNILFGFVQFKFLLFLIKFSFIIIYVLLIDATFNLYKEYKIISIGEGNNYYQNLNDIEMRNNNNNYYYGNNRNNNNNNNNNNNQFVPFQGQGYTWG
jgi:hypothetical protein